MNFHINEELKKVYHSLIKEEFNKIKKRETTLRNTHLTYNDIKGVLNRYNIHDIKKWIDFLKKENLLIELYDGKYRTFLLDVASRASDVRIKYNGVKYVLETDLELVERPLLNNNFVLLNPKLGGKNAEFLKELKNLFDKKIPGDYEKFVKALEESGIAGFSKFQFHAIKNILASDNHILINAPAAFGKTYIFLIPVLLEAISHVKQKKKGPVALIFYPRKSLGADQMGRIIRLIYNINKLLGINITVSIHDGDTEKYSEEGVEYRGIHCPLESEDKFIPLKVKNGILVCNNGHKFDFVKVRKEEILEDPPTILITNIWTFQHRFIRFKSWKTYLTENIKYLVFDEIHAYRSIVAGILNYIIKIFKLLVCKPRLILSSATIPKIEEYLKDLVDNEYNNFLKLVYDEREFGKDDSKLELYLLVGINPETSWETYINELAVILLTIRYLQKNRKIQSLIFLDNVKEINRLGSQIDEAIKLGSPKDRFIETIDGSDPYSLWVYDKNYKLPKDQIEKSDLINKLREYIKNDYDVHYADKANRGEIEFKIKKNEIGLVLCTSTLELGVDYKNVGIIVNAGIPFETESIIQRVGRAGRSEETLNTCLSIIVIRNNPIEYYYIYKGLKYFLEFEGSKIPIAKDNILVNIYSILLYTAAKFAKKGREPNKIVGLEEILKSSKDNIEHIIKELNIQCNKEYLLNKITKLSEIIKLAKDEKLDEYSQQYNYNYIKSSIENDIRKLKIELEEVLKNLQEVINLINKRDRKDIEKYIHEIENFLKLKDNEIDHKEVRKMYNSIDELRSKLKNIPGENINELRKKLNEIQNSLHNLNQKFHQIEELQQPVQLNITYDYDEFSLNLAKYLNNLEKDPKNNIIILLEELLGFHFMGTEFIDHEINIEPYWRKEVLSRFITRMPPFEIFKIPWEEKDMYEITRIVGGRYFWFAELINGQNNEVHVKYEVDNVDYCIPNTISLKDILEDPIILTMTDRNKYTKYFIKYGSERISNTKIDNRYTVASNISKLKDKTNPNYKYVYDRTINKLNELDRRIKNLNPWGLNFFYVAFCTNGYGVSTDPFDDRCPFQDKCKECDGKRFWYTKRKQFPKFFAVKRIRFTGEGTIDGYLSKSFIQSIRVVSPDELKEDILILYDKVNIRTPIIFGHLYLEFPIKPLSYKIRTALIVISFNPIIVSLIINAAIKNPELKRFLEIKYRFKNMIEEFGNISISKLVKEIKNKDIKKDELVEFGKYVLLHTLAHLLLLYIIKRTKCMPDEITYHIDPSNNRIYILEMSKNDGLGIVESIKQEINSKGEEEFLDEFYEEMLNFLEDHREDISKYEEDVRKEFSKLLSDINKDAAIESLMNEIKRFNDEIKDLLKYIDIATYRQEFSKHIAKNEKEQFLEGASEYIVPCVLHYGTHPHLCADSCNECLIFLHGCLDPFKQFYTLSRNLVTFFLSIVKNKKMTISGKGLGSYLQKIFEGGDKIYIKVPFIDDYGVEIIKGLIDKKDINIKTKVANLKILEKYKNHINLVFDESFHSKEYLITHGEQYIKISGSLNLTRSSLIDKEENLTIEWSEKLDDEVKLFINEFKY